MRSAKDVFDAWAQDYHADGMEKGHRKSVDAAFEMIPSSEGNYLEIGFGNGYGIRHMATHQFKGGQCYGLDVSPQMVKKAESNLQDLNNVHLATGDFLTWQPPESVRFSCIFSMEVFYYFPDISAGIQRAVSLLTPGGMLMVLVNHYLENEKSHSWSEDLGTPMVLWSEKEYVEAFIQAGFKDVRQCRLNAEDGKPGTLCTLCVL